MQRLTAVLAATSVFAACVCAEGVRPYELDWAGRVKDEIAPLVDFEDLDGWRVEASDAVAEFATSRDQLLWGDHVARLTYRADGPKPVIRLLPPAPIPIAGAFDAVSCWIYGNNIFGRDPSTPPAIVEILLQSDAGRSTRSNERARGRCVSAAA